MAEINLELNAPVPKYDRKVFKSSPISRLKSAPRGKKIENSRNTKNFTNESRITVKSSVKERIIDPLPLSDREKIRSKKIELKPKSNDKINFPAVNKNLSNLTNSTTIKVVEKKITKWEAGNKNRVNVKTSTKTSCESIYNKYIPRNSPNKLQAPDISSRNTGSENTSNGNTSNGNTSSGNTSNGNTSSGNTSSGNTSNGNTSSGNTSNGNTSSGNTSSGNTSSGNTSNGNTSSGNTSTSGSTVTTKTPEPYTEITDSEDAPISIDPSVFSTEELETLMTDLSITSDSAISDCSNSQCDHLDVSTALKLCENICKSPCKLICQYHCIRAIDCGGLCLNRCLNPTDDKVRERVIALLGTKIKFPVTRSIILQSKDTETKSRVNANLERLNEKLNERLKEWGTRVDAIKEAENGEDEDEISTENIDTSRKCSIDRAVRFSQIFARQLFLPRRRSMARITENEEADIKGCRYLRCTSEAQELSFLDKCEMGIRNTIKRGSILARRVSTAASNNLPMRITIRTVERSNDYSESSNDSSETDYDNISSIEITSDSDSEDYTEPGRQPRMNRLVSMLPNSVIKKLRSQKWKNWIAKVKAGNDLHEMPEAPSD